MKKSLACTVSVASLGVVMLCLAAAPVKAQGQGGMRIAVINMDVVRKGYKKIDFYKQEIQDLAKPYEGEIKKYKDWYDQWSKVASTETSSKEERDKAAKQAVICKRRLEDLSAEANKKIMDASQRQVLLVYREIEDVVESYAKANGIQLVLHYADPIDPSQKYSPPNIHRKLNGVSNVGATGLMYSAPGIDISQEIVNVLNQRYPATSVQTPSN